jgi:chromosomal replication initiation ATPase DnaA
MGSTAIKRIQTGPTRYGGYHQPAITRKNRTTMNAIPIESRKCCYCDQDFQPEDKWDNECPPCVKQRSEKAAAQKLEENRATIKARFLAATPARMRNTDTQHPGFSKNAWPLIRDHKFTSEKPWLGLVGETGCCKTRMVFLRAEIGLVKMTTAKRVPTFEIITGYEFAETVMLQFSDADKESARVHLDKLRYADLLILDDVDKARMTPAIASEFFALVDARHRDNAMTLWTANTPPEQFAAGIAANMAAPCAGRFNDSSTIFNLK